MDNETNAPAHEMTLTSPPATMEADVVDVTTESFMAEVVDASQNRLVLLDLWAPWCGPCKQLTPVLEKLIAESNGGVRLAKMNIDEYPAVAQQLQVQSIPAVFAFKDGRPVDGFMGALPESELKKFIDKHADAAFGPSPAQALMETAAEALGAGQIDDAMECYQAALAQEPDNVKAMAGLAQAALAANNIEAAAAVLAAAPSYDGDPDLASARAALALAEKTADQSGDNKEIQALQGRLSENENDHQARFDLALAYHGAGAREAALETLLDLVARDRSWQDDGARKQLVELFDAYGAADELVVAARKRLSSLLFS